MNYSMCECLKIGYWKYRKNFQESYSLSLSPDPLDAPKVAQMLGAEAATSMTASLSGSHGGDGVAPTGPETPNDEVLFCM